MPSSPSVRALYVLRSDLTPQRLAEIRSQVEKIKVATGL